MKHRKRLNMIMHGSAFDPKFRERLMLAVTQVNECRFCSRFHTKQALVGGMSRGEIDAILQGEFGDCPPGELSAVLYAHHWAETEGQIDQDIQDKLVEQYGSVIADDIGLILRLIKTGNYTGNTVDYFIYCISGGRWGR